MPKSVVWEFFKKNDDGKKVTCNLCSTLYKYSGNTTTFVNHLKKKHIVQYSEAIGVALPSSRAQENSTVPAPQSSEVSRDLNESQSASRHTLPPINDEPAPKRQKQLRLVAPTKLNQKAGDDALLDMIVLDMQPLQIVENTGFKNFTEKLNPGYVLPSRKKLTQMLEDRYNICREALKQQLQDVNDIALTTDIWSSDSQTSFLSVTAHFVRDATLVSLVISTTELKENHTSLNIANVIETILTEWNIFDKVVTIVTDNAASMKKAVKDFLNKRNHFCVAHTLNLAVRDCITKDNEQATQHLKNDEVLSIISKSRAIVTHFKQSNKSALTLRDMQTQMNVDVIKLKQDVQTRWNSTFIMFERLLRVKVPLSATLSLLESSPPNLTSAEWSILEDCVAVLQPMEKITTVLSAESYPTLSCVIPLVRGLQQSLLSKTPTTNAGKHLQKSLVEVVDKRLSVYEENRTASKATLLDPRFKKKAFGIDSAAENASKYVLEELAQYQTNTNLRVTELDNRLAIASTSQAAPEITDDIWAYLDSKVGVAHETPISSAAIILKQYLELPYLDRKQDPLQFWEQRKHIFPSLCQMAYKYLCTPASSVPSERLFSKAGLVTNQRRNRLMPKKVDQILFLNAYCKEKKKF